MLTNPAVGPDVSPEAVLRTLSGLQVVQGGCESVAPVSAAPPGSWRRVWPQKTKKPGLPTEPYVLFDAWE